MGRPRKKAKDLPLGVYSVKGRFYVRPVNAEMRRVFATTFPGRKCAPLGADKHEARKRWVQLFVTDRPESAQAGTVAELIERYERDIIPTLHERTGRDRKGYCKRLRDALGGWKYARSEAEAATGPFLRSIHITRYLRDQEAAGRPVAGNKEIRCLSRIFRLAKTLWGYTEYNPCLQIEHNIETPRGVYVTDDMFRRVYDKAPAVLQCMMDLAQMVGARRGMILKLTLADVTPEGLRVTLNKRKRTEAVRRQIVRWTDDLRAVIDRALELRAKVRGGQREIKDLDTAPLFLNRLGKAFSETGFNSMWQRARAAAGFEAHEIHFHDLKAKSVSDSPNEIDAMNRGGHLDLRTTRRIYRRKPIEVVPLPRVSGKPA
ncbi:MAG TPA: tyrosine-type recombinase/integrase [Burkholderiales bacterium]|nr:tyrosine-type recombinase/integrase [Burkholderiales bacterium]